MNNLRTWVVSPCYHDVESYLRVREEARQHLVPVVGSDSVRFVLVDDSAGQDPAILTKIVGLIRDVEVITPPYNLGPQEALVFGLRKLAPRVNESDLVVTIDSDGEDRPSDILRLVRPLLENRESLRKVCVARRTQRKEGLIFKVCYALYKPIFFVLTGTVIRNGTFAAYRGWLLKEVIYHPDFDYSYSSAFVSLPVMIEQVPIARGSRFAGQPKMRFFRLGIHGFRMLMPFGEKIAIRGVLSSLVLFSALSCLLVAQKLFCPVVPSRQFLVTEVCTLAVLLFLACFFVVLFVLFTQARSRSLRKLNTDEI